jgi:hypothetical protein
MSAEYNFGLYRSAVINTLWEIQLLLSNFWVILDTMVIAQQNVLCVLCVGHLLVDV